MTRQEVIREGTARHIFLEQRTNMDYIHRRPCWEELGMSAKQPFLKKADNLITYLHSQGVVVTKCGFYSDLMEPLIKEQQGGGEVDDDNGGDGNIIVPSIHME